MFQVAAISVATEPVSRIRAANLRDPTSVTQTPAESADSASESVFEDPAAVVHIGAQARALARRDSRSERPSQPPTQPRAANGDGPLAEAARTAAQARASATVEGGEAQTEAADGIENPLAEAASTAAKALWDSEDEGENEATIGPEQADDSSPDLVRGPPSRNSASNDDVELSAAEERKLDEMQQRDREVRQQEQSEATSAQFTGPVRYEYRMGPDGKLYAVEGSAPIDVQPVEGDPAATLRKMEAVERAARSGSESSIADQQVASEAARLAQRARAELAAARYNESRDVVDVRQQEPTRETEPERELQGGDGTQAGVQGETSRDSEPVTDVLASAAQSVEGTFSEAASTANLSGAPIDLALLNPRTTPPPLRRYEEQQRPSAYPGGGFQLVA